MLKEDMVTAISEKVERRKVLNLHVTKIGLHASDFEMKTEWVYYPLPLIFGVISAVVLNLLTPFYPSLILFIIVAIMLLGAISYSVREKIGLLQLRVMFIGASVTSILFAFHTYFFSIVSIGLIQIPIDALVGLFRSILITSFFSLLERLTKFLEDRSRLS